MPVKGGKKRAGRLPGDLKTEEQHYNEFPELSFYYPYVLPLVPERQGPILLKLRVGVANPTLYLQKSAARVIAAIMSAGCPPDTRVSSGPTWLQ